MRVCLVNLWDKGAPIHYSVQLANSLAESPGMDVSIVIPESTTAIDLFNSRVTIHAVDVITEFSLRGLARAPLQLLKSPQFISGFRRIKPDIIHIVNAHVWLIWALPILARRYPIVSTIHDVAPHPGLDNTLRKRLEIRTLIQNSEGMFVHGDNLKGKLLRENPGVLNDQVCVVHHGDFAFFTHYPCSSAEEPGTILFFGRIREYKGLPDLVQAYAIIKNRVKEAKLMIAGEGPLGELQNQLSQLSDCEIHNRFIPDEDVPGFFRRASVVVCPYTEASQSGVIPIAYAFHKPVVATDVGCIRASVDGGKTGYLVPPHSPQALAEAIIRLLADPELRRAMGEGGHRKMQAELGWDQIARKTIQMYEYARERNTFC